MTRFLSVQHNSQSTILILFKLNLSGLLGRFDESVHLMQCKCQVFWPRYSFLDVLCRQQWGDLIVASDRKWDEEREEWGEILSQGGYRIWTLLLLTKTEKFQWWLGEFKRRIRDEYEWMNIDFTEGCKPSISANGSSMTREICWLSLTRNRPNEFRSVCIPFFGFPSDNYHLAVCSSLHHSPSSLEKWVRVWLRVAPSIIRSLLFPILLFQFVPGSQNFLTSLASILVCDNQWAPHSCTAILCCASFLSFSASSLWNKRSQIETAGRQAGWEKKTTCKNAMKSYIHGKE